MPTVLLIRHTSREMKSKQDFSDEISEKGRNEVNELVAYLKRVKLVPNLILTSQYKHSIQTAELLAQGNKIIEECEALTPHCERWTFDELMDEMEKENVGILHHNVIAIIGHEPRLGKMFTRLTSTRIGPFKRAQLVAVEADDPKTFLQAKGTMAFRFPVEAFEEDKLRPKVQSKMQVATFLAGFTFAVLSTLVTSMYRNFDCWYNVTAFICLSISFFLFVASVYIYDTLSMPEGFWVSEDRSFSEKWLTKSFKKAWRDNGPLYAYMIRTWTLFFTPALIFAYLGFLSLLWNISANKSQWIAVGSFTLLSLAVIFLYHKLRPKLGTD